MKRIIGKWAGTKRKSSKRRIKNRRRRRNRKISNWRKINTIRKNRIKNKRRFRNRMRRMMNWKMRSNRRKKTKLLGEGTGRGSRNRRKKGEWKEAGWQRKGEAKELNFLVESRSPFPGFFVGGNERQLSRFLHKKRVNGGPIAGQ